MIAPADRIGLVTGAGSGIGRATALEFAHTGAKVAVLDINAEAAAATASAIANAGGSAIAVQVDIGDDGSVKAAVENVVTTYGRLDFAVNNAGVPSFHRQLDEMTVDESARVVHVNLVGTFLCLKYELAVLSDAGAIVNVASSGGLHSMPNAPAYVASKHGIVGLTKAAARDYASRQIRVNSLCPGATQTPFFESIATGTSMAANAAAATPLGRVAQPEEVAAAAVWLCSPAASYLTGIALPLDGGRWQ
ncbi:SDR family NAD(P)-dependent oxidoreductase [Amycolatopsis pithecellobii]|uniref:SDR family oxidoreductase n=1 Tax=Amycolatopsis pithecellobii TaxID=664692 RepID=A0A6N7Z8P9_9PSEU|nr:glucose 1-dehydrogenase [Amycolatopsis pithecellobii]MTD58000.1 SDR family oxidoreductase [Amycolatopsis pithecellobii]